ncbi:hypothetical protein DBR42_22265, partial [Pelomonas sp. HMWF004]
MRNVQSVRKSYTSYRHRYMLILLSVCCTIVLTVPLHVILRLFMADSTELWVLTTFITAALSIASFLGLSMVLDEQLV